MRPLFKCEKIAELEKGLYEARKELRRYWAGVLSCLPDTKENQDLGHSMTPYDLECQRIIFDCIAGTGLNITAFSEDNESALNFGKTGDFHLLIDPLDGTHNAILGFPAFTSSVALYHNDAYAFGWVYDISRDLVYSAASGEGAYIQSPIILKRLHTRKVSRIEDMRIAFHRPRTGKKKRKIENLMWASNKIRVCSCSSLEICLIAAGTLDAFIDIDTPGHERSCDIAAAELILREAGGSLFYASGAPRFALPPSSAAISDYGTLIALSSHKLIHIIT
ncbi:inositol monophosphatase family protein [Pseudomonas gingeri]